MNIKEVSKGNNHLSSYSHHQHLMSCEVNSAECKHDSPPDPSVLNSLPSPTSFSLYLSMTVAAGHVVGQLIQRDSIKAKQGEGKGGEAMSLTSIR